MTISNIFVAIQFLCITVILLTGQIIPEDKMKLALLIVSAVPGLWAMSAFRFRFSVFPDVPVSHVLNTNRIYKYIRHPMYSSVIFMTLIWVWNDYSTMRSFVWIILVLDMSIKLRYEEKLLTKRFPEYKEYMKRSKMFIPFIY